MAISGRFSDLNYCKPLIQIVVILSLNDFVNVLMYFWLNKLNKSKNPSMPKIAEILDENEHFEEDARMQLSKILG